MAGAIADPQELRRFANMLNRFNNDMQNNMSVLSSQLNNLGTSWRDQENQKFCEEFEQTLQVMSKFVESANLHIPFLLRKAQRLEEYLQQR
ncbi:MAG: WXG100 family type VII secretion target [Planctomycetia bacterium]